jgi:DNA/RNA endonuclease YhcR with UshA esterase domain
MSIEGTITAKRLGSTDANTTIATFNFSAAARRTGIGTELQGTPIITPKQNTLTGITASNIVIDAATGNMNLRVTGLASQNIQWKAEINVTLI